MPDLPLTMELKKIIHCARCGGDHINVVATRLTQPVYADDQSVEWTHWAPCPVNGEPILACEVTEPAS